MPAQSIIHTLETGMTVYSITKFQADRVSICTQHAASEGTKLPEKQHLQKNYNLDLFISQ